MTVEEPTRDGIDDLESFVAETSEHLARLQAADRDHSEDELSMILALETANEELRVATEEIRAQRDELDQLALDRQAEQWWGERLRTILPVPLFETNNDGVIRSVNPAAVRLVGREQLRLIRKPIQALIDEADRPVFRTLLNSLAEAPRVVRIHVLRATGDATEADCYAMPRTGSRGQTGVEIVMAPVTVAGTGPSDFAKLLGDLMLLPLEEHDRHQLLGTVVGRFADVVVPDSGVSVTIGAPVSPDDVASDDGFAQQIDGIQMTAGEGPCETAWRDNAVVVSDDIREDPRWPRFAAATEATELSAAAAAPVRIGEQIVGVLNIYARRVGSIDAAARTRLELLADSVGALIHHLDEGRQIVALHTQMDEALASRAAIDQAKGILMARFRCSADDAFEHMSRASQNSNVKVRDLATAIIERAIQGSSHI